jgi:hypothetical protein
MGPLGPVGAIPLGSGGSGAGATIFGCPPLGSAAGGLLVGVVPTCWAVRPNPPGKVEAGSRVANVGPGDSRRERHIVARNCGEIMVGLVLGRWALRVPSGTAGFQV